MMWGFLLVAAAVAHEGHQHDDGSGGFALNLLPETLCEAQWPNMEESAEPITRRCNDYYIQMAYPKGFDPQKRPRFGHPVELRLSTAELTRMIQHADAACHVDEPVEDAACFRARDFYAGILERKPSLEDGYHSFGPLIEKILAGQRLTRVELRIDNPGAQWSPLTLHKLKGAVYARHGQRFEDPDMEVFFYGPREAPIAGLPRQPKTADPVELSAIDQANLALLAEAVKQQPAETKKYRW